MSVSNYFLLAPSFHGATLLSLILGNHTKIIALGDTLPTLSFDQGCGCGKKISKCEFWKSIKQRVPVNGVHHILTEYPRLISSRLGNQALLYITMKLGIRLDLRNSPFEIGFNGLVEAALREKPSAEVFLDGHKSITRAMASSVTNIGAAGIIHLIRDPRAFSLASKKVGVPVADAIHQWLQYHRAVQKIKKNGTIRVLDVRYRDLCEQPQEQIARILSFMNLPQEELVKRHDPVKTHWIGNASLIGFNGEIRQGNLDKWKKELSNNEIIQIESATKREMVRYGYRPYERDD